MKLILSSLILLFATFLSQNQVQGANILFFWVSSGHSHRIGVWPLVEKLLENGHKITYISPYPSKTPYKPHPNLTDMVPENLKSDCGLVNIDSVNIRLNQGLSAIDNLWLEFDAAGLRSCESILKNPKVTQWVEKASFDLVVINGLFNDCGYGFAHLFKAIHVIYSTPGYFQWWGDAYGLPQEGYPEFQYHYNLNMTFVQRVWNQVTILYWEFKRRWVTFPYLEGLLKKHLKGLGDLPPLEEIERNTSLLLVNQHFSEEYPRSLPPMVVPVAGLHMKYEVHPIPQDIREFIEFGEDVGFVFLSFGTYATLGNFPKRLQETFLKAMGRVKTKFIVKLDGEPPQGVPKNVKIVKWISQQDILAQPKIKGYIGHGGLFGIQEAVYHGVPMIVMPLFADQDYNAVRIVGKDRGILLDIIDVTEDKLYDAITALMTNPKYKKNMLRYSALFKDRPEKPVETAVWWIEYALRNKDDLSHLRPIGITKPWYQKRLLDIWGFLALLVLAVLTTFYLFVKILLRVLFSKSNNTPTSSKNLKKGKKSN